MSLLLLTAGLIFGLLLLLNNLIKAITRSEQVRFFDVLLAFLTTLLPVAALITNSISDAPDPNLDRYARWAAIGLFAISFIILIIELFRPQRLRGSRALLALVGAMLIVISTFTVPFLSVYFDLQAESQQVVAASTPDAASDDPDATEESRPETTVERLFKAIREIVTNEIELDEEEVFRMLDEGVPLARIIEDNGGDLAYVIDRLTVILSDSLREAAARGEINSIQAALLLSQMENLVRFAVNNNINEIEDRLNGGPTPTGTRQRLLSMLTQSPTAESTGGSTPQPSHTPEPTLRPSNTRTLTPSLLPTESPSPRPSATPSMTRFAYHTRTFTPSPTAVTPCIATVNYNLRLRAEPTSESATLLVIPFATGLQLTGRSADSTWWLTSFAGETGWVDGEYISLSAGCENLPPLQ